MRLLIVLAGASLCSLAECAEPISTASPSTHWAFQPIRQPSLPVVRRTQWSKTAVDRFILAALESKGLSPSNEADRRGLIRRVAFDLTGLPPAPADVEAFELDSSPDAFEKVVDRLISSPAHGEHWARHWLDVARYADSKGYVFLEERRYPFAYTYRDYVIRSLNVDLPFDRFVREQLAADKLVAPGDNGPTAAMGFLTLGRRFLNNIHDIIDDRIDVVSRGLLGLSVTCARCHDHKFDPIPQRDYYSMYGVFASSVEPRQLPLLAERTSGPVGDAFQKEVDRLEAKKSKYEKDNAEELKKGNRKFREGLKAIQQEIDKHVATHPGSPPRAMSLADAPSPFNPRVFQRGNPGMPGPAVPRQFLEVVAGPNRKPFTDGSGRLELAKAIASPDNPLTARVIVNRVWAWHFGEGLVNTPSDFGVRTPPPSHPELLDWLASRFIADGWSLKKLHRLIVLSSTYRQSSDDRPDLAKVDPENRLLGRMNRRRLEFESLRDSILAVSGKLDPRAGGPAIDLHKPPFSTRRTIYGFVDRQNLPGVMRSFDFASPDAHCPQRHETTVPQQALYLMNNPFVQQQASALAKRADAATIIAKIENLYRFAFARKPSGDELTLAVEFLGAKPTDDAWSKFAQVLVASNEFMFVD